MAKGEKILHSDIIEAGNPFEVATNGLIELMTNMDKYVKSMKGNKMGSGSDLKNFNQDVYVANQAVKEFDKTQKAIIDTQVKVANASLKQAEALEVEKKVLKEQNDLNKQNAVLNNEAAGTLEKLRAANKKLSAEREKLNLSTKAGQQRLREINKEIDKNTALLKKNSDQYTKTKMNIGDYGAQVGMLGGKFGLLTVAMHQARAVMNIIKLGFVSLKAAIVSTGIGALVIAIVSLVQWFKNTALGAQTLRKVLEPINAIFQTITSVVKQLGEGLYKMFSGDFLGGWKQMKTAIAGVNSEYERQLALQKSITLLQNLQHKKYIEDVVKIAQLEAAIAKQREIANNEQEYSLQEQIAAINEARKLTEQLYAIKQDAANREVALRAQQSQMSADSEEEENALAAAIANSINVQAEASNALRSLLRRQTTLYNKYNAELEKEKELQKDILIGRTEISNASQKNIDSVTKETYALIQLRDKYKDVNVAIDENIAKEEEIKRKRIEASQATADAISYIANNEYSIKADLLNQELQDAQKLYEHELLMAGDNLEAKAAASRKYQKEEKELKKQQAKLNKEQSIFNATVAMFEAIVKASTAGPGIGLVLSILIAAYDAYQIARLVATPLPSFRKGLKEVKPGLGSKGTDKDGHIVQVHDGEGILTKDQNKPLTQMGIDYDRIPGLVSLGQQFTAVAPVLETIAKMQLAEQRQSNSYLRRFKFPLNTGYEDINGDRQYFVN